MASKRKREVKGLSLKNHCEAMGKERLLTQWDAAHNLPLTPETVGHASCKPVWWRCEKGHRWQTKVSSRTGGFTGCPGCNTERLAEKRRRRQGGALPSPESPKQNEEFPR